MVFRLPHRPRPAPPGQHGPRNAPRRAAARDAQREAARDAAFAPSFGDIVMVRAMLCNKTGIPVDVVDEILDYAEYWAHSTNEIDFRVEHQSALRVTGTSPDKNKFVLRSFPVGLTHIEGDKDLAEELAYDTTEATPTPLVKPRDAAYFRSLTKYPTPKLEHPARKIVFTIKSKDQGWGGRREDHDTYHGSWTWFEAGLEKFEAEQTCEPQCTKDVRHKSVNSTASALPVCALRPVQPPLEPARAHSERGKYNYVHTLDGEPHAVIQRNKTACKEVLEHVVTWSWNDDVKPDSDAAMELVERGRGRATGDGEFVRGLEMGDVVTVWAKARFPGWSHHIDRVKVDVYWAV